MSERKKYRKYGNPCKYCGGIISWDKKINDKFPIHIDDEGYIINEGECPKFKSKKENLLISENEKSLETSKDKTQFPFILTEVFPIQTNTIPKLYAYQLDIGGQNRPLIGGKLSYRLRKVFKGHWVWTSNRIITDINKDQKEMMDVVEKLWHEQPEIYKDLRGVKIDSNWQPNAESRAVFVSIGLIEDIDLEIRKILSKKVQNIGNARIERVYDRRGWVVQGHPSVSLSISSRLIYIDDLKTYFNKRRSTDDLLGLMVADKTSTLKGEIIEIVGELAQHRNRLLAYTQRMEMQDIIKKAPDNELIVRVSTSRDQYDYVISALRIILRMQDFSRFGINAKLVQKAVRIEPDLRSKLVKEISNLIMTKNFKPNPYNSKDTPDLFLNATDVQFAPSLCFGDGTPVQYDEHSLLDNLRQKKLYKISDRFENGVPIRIGIINAIGSVPTSAFWSKIEKELQNLNLNIYLIPEQKIKSIERVDLENAIENLQKQNPDILVALFPDEQDDEEEDTSYYHLKSLTVGRGIPNQVVEQSTLEKIYALPNIILGILGKTGNIPFILAEPLSYADLVVGIDIARERKAHLPGTINATAIARIYFHDGKFLRYFIHDAPLEGETIPENVLQSLFPVNEFKNKRVIIHRDGYFRGNEKQALKNWAKKIGAEFYLIEIIKTGTPRLYAVQDNKTQQPMKGTAFKLNDKEAFLVSSLPPFKNATPQPLHIRVDGALTINQAIHSILSLTILHYGSLRPPRLPVSIHYSDRIAYLVLRGIKPKNLEGDIPFWL